MEKEEERRLRRVRWIVRVPIPISSIPLKIFRKPRALPTLSTKMADSICTSSWKLFTRWRHGLTSVLSAFVRHPSAFWNCFWTWAWSLHPSHRPIIPAAINTTTTIAISNSSSNSKPEMDCWVSTKKNFHVTRTVFVLTLSPECSSTSDARTVAVTPGVIRLPILSALRAYFWWLNFTAYPANTSDPSYAKRSYADTLWSKWLTFFMPSSVSVSIQDFSSRQSVNNLTIIYLFLTNIETQLKHIPAVAGQKRNSRLGVEQSGMSYVPNFSSPRTIEGHVINCIFKPFVTRLTASLKFLKSSENVVSVLFILMMCSMLKRFRFILFVCFFFKALYCDVRQLLAYIKDVHGGIFRRVLLSGLLDSAARPQQPQDTPPENSGYFK